MSDVFYRHNTTKPHTANMPHVVTIEITGLNLVEINSLKHHNKQ